LRAELSAERDEQLDVLMDRLSREHVQQQQALREESAASVKRAREEASTQAARLSEHLEAAQRRAASLEAEVSRLERSLAALRQEREADSAKIAALEARSRGLEAELSDARRIVNEGAAQHRAKLDEAGQAKERELAAARAEAKRLERSLEEERARVEQQRRDAERRQEGVIGDLEGRVKRTLQAKDETISELRVRCSAADNKIREFEYLLARQREELLSEITGAPSR